MNPYFYITLYPADPRVEDADMSGLCVYHNKVLTSSRKRHNKDTIYLFIFILKNKKIHLSTLKPIFWPSGCYPWRNCVANCFRIILPESETVLSPPLSLPPARWALCPLTSRASMLWNYFLPLPRSIVWRELQCIILEMAKDLQLAK